MKRPGFFIAGVFLITGALFSQQNPEKPAEAPVRPEGTDIAETPVPPVSEKLYLEWTASEGAHGYLVQIKDRNESVVLEQKVPASRIDFLLPPGAYRSRIAPLNKFERPIRWSDWQPFQVHRAQTPVVAAASAPEVHGNQGQVSLQGNNFFEDTRVTLVSGDRRIPATATITQEGDTQKVTLSYDASQVPNGQYDLLIENPGGMVLRREGVVNVTGSTANTAANVNAVDNRPVTTRTRDAVPGLSEFSQGRYGSGLLWAGAFSGLLAGGLHEYAAARTARQTAVSDPSISFYNNPSLVLAGGTTLGPQPFFLGYGLYNISRLSDLKNSYNVHQRNQVIYGASALILFSVYALKDSPYGWKTLVPGLPLVMSGNRRGYVWMGLFAGLAAGGIFEYAQANRVAAQANNNALYQIYGNPVGFFAAAAAVPGVSTHIALASLALSQRASDQASYNAHRNNQAVIGGVSAFMLVAYLLDYSINRPQAASLPSNVSTGPQIDLYAQSIQRTVYTAELHHTFQVDFSGP